MTLLAVSGIVKRFDGVTAVGGVSLTVDACELVALIGANGAGKSTLFNVVNGQMRPDSGSVALEGREIVGLAPHAVFRRGVARTFQVAQTFASMTVLENVQAALISLHGRTRNVASVARGLYREEAAALVERVGMAAQASRLCGVLAYGDLKRVELALALAGRPKLLLMDEPTAGMAPAERRALMGLAAEIAREREIGVLFTEHDMDIVFGHATRIVVLDRGRVIAAGLPEAVRAHARVRAVYLGT